MSLTSFAVKNYQFTIILFVLALGVTASAPKSPMLRLAISLPGATAQQPGDF